MGHDGGYLQNIRTWLKREPTIDSQPSSKNLQTPEIARSVSMDSYEITKPAWKYLFAFTTYKHIVILIPAILSSLFSGALATVNSYLVGKLFGYFTEFGAGQLSKDDFKQKINKYNVYIVILATGSWIFNSLAFFLWHTFGELHARSARVRIFGALLTRKVEWFDRRNDGVEALATRLLA
jgi:ATP-binding cassette, subfamily B (MDR/TAP), member 1